MSPSGPEAAAAVVFERLDGDQAGAILDELGALYQEVYAEPPYQWGPEHLAAFQQRFEERRRQPGLTLVTARVRGELLAYTFGMPLKPTTPWWQNLLEPLPDEVTREWDGRTFAIVELLVRAPWRRQHIGQRLHDLLLQDRTEERATLTVLPAAEAARAAYDKWGWQQVALKRSPVPQGPVFEVRVRPLTHAILEEP
jgi:GNAT superfamily N-acetyltransferase